MIGRIEFNCRDGITRYFDENGSELDADTARQIIAEREQFLAEQVANPVADEPIEG